MHVSGLHTMIPCQHVTDRAIGTLRPNLDSGAIFIPFVRLHIIDPVPASGTIGLFWRQWLRRVVAHALDDTQAFGTALAE